MRFWLLFYLTLLFPLRTFSQFSIYFTEANSEKQNLKTEIRKHWNIPDGLEIRQIQQHNSNFQILNYQLYKNGFPLKDVSISAIIYNGKILLSGNYERSTVFAEQNEALTPAEWVFDSLYGKYKLLHYADSQGIRFYRNPSNSEIEFIENQKRFLIKDTWNMGRVFFPDPLSIKNRFYGGLYTDRNDSSYAELDNEMQLKRIECTFINDSFLLQNKYIQFAEVSDPVRPHAKDTGNFIFYRSDPRFEEVNVFYHIQELSKWWDTLGFSNYRDTAILDVHALFGADESAMDPTKNPVTIEFGDGGVDDGEDADAPTHEYTHVAFQNVIPNGYNGTQRKAVEEGLCDFMAIAYSQRLSPFQTDWVYNWDGHNEFWDGRNLNNQRKYPQDLTNQPHIDGQLFGGAIWDLAKEIGFDSAVSLMMYAMPLLPANINMVQAAQVFVMVDSLFYNGKNQWPLVKAFYPRNLLPNLEVTNPQTTSFFIRNSSNFASGNAALEIIPFRTGILQVFSCNGQLLQSVSLHDGQSKFLKPEDFQSGIYILRFHGQGYKIIKI